jgi:hypothetical protein
MDSKEKIIINLRKVLEEYKLNINFFTTAIEALLTVLSDGEKKIKYLSYFQHYLYSYPNISVKNLKHSKDYKRHDSSECFVPVNFSPTIPKVYI